MKSGVAELIISFKVGCIIIYGDSLEPCLLVFIVLDHLHFVVKLRVMRYFLSDLEVFNGSD